MPIATYAYYYSRNSLRAGRRSTVVVAVPIYETRTDVLIIAIIAYEPPDKAAVVVLSIASYIASTDRQPTRLRLR